MSGKSTSDLPQIEQLTFDQNELPSGGITWNHTYVDPTVSETPVWQTSPADVSFTGKRMTLNIARLGAAVKVTMNDNDNLWMQGRLSHIMESSQDGSII